MIDGSKEEMEKLGMELLFATTESNDKKKLQNYYGI